jgi:hypothetical protein
VIIKGARRKQGVGTTKNTKGWGDGGRNRGGAEVGEGRRGLGRWRRGTTNYSNWANFFRGKRKRLGRWRGTTKNAKSTKGRGDGGGEVRARSTGREPWPQGSGD